MGFFLLLLLSSTITANVTHTSTQNNMPTASFFVSLNISDIPTKSQSHLNSIPTGLTPNNCIQYIHKLYKKVDKHDKKHFKRLKQPTSLPPSFVKALCKAIYPSGHAFLPSFIDGNPQSIISPVNDNSGEFPMATQVNNHYKHTKLEPTSRTQITVTATANYGAAITYP